jgi:predicted RNA-binding Zn-ribbon protein involved in translation (DUF1610 family)
MLKFLCQHCGQRIAVPARHLGKLVTCAECGKPTHPLAREIVGTQAVTRSAAATTPPATSPPPAAAHSACANCGGTIGRLQASHLWEDQRVCGPCYHVLSAESSLCGPRGAPVVATRVRPVAPDDSFRPAPLPPVPGLREQIVRGLMVFVVGVVALYGALTLLRDLAGLIAVAAVTVLALLALYGVFRSRWSARVRRDAAGAEAALLAVRGR